MQDALCLIRPKYIGPEKNVLASSNMAAIHNINIIKVSRKSLPR